MHLTARKGYFMLHGDRKTSYLDNGTITRSVTQLTQDLLTKNEEFSCYFLFKPPCSIRHNVHSRKKWKTYLTLRLIGFQNRNKR